MQTGSREASFFLEIQHTRAPGSEYTSIAKARTDWEVGWVWCPALTSVLRTQKDPRDTLFDSASREGRAPRTGHFYLPLPIPPGSGKSRKRKHKDCDNWGPGRLGLRGRCACELMQLWLFVRDPRQHSNTDGVGVSQGPASSWGALGTWWLLEKGDSVCSSVASEFLLCQWMALLPEARGSSSWHQWVTKKKKDYEMERGMGAVWEKLGVGKLEWTQSQDIVSLSKLKNS